MKTKTLEKKRNEVLKLTKNTVAYTISVIDDATETIGAAKFMILSTGGSYVNKGLKSISKSIRA